MKLSLNAVIHIRLSDAGKQQLRAHFLRLFSQNADRADESVSICHLNADGSYRFMLWELMYIFGDQMYMGNTTDMTESMEMEVVNNPAIS